MSLNNNDFFFIAKEFILNLLEKYKDRLEKDTISTVMHYVNHDEYEMAYEGLLIDLMSIEFNPKDIDILFCVNIGKEMNLDKESVFNYNFWIDFTEYMRRHQ